MGLGSLFQKLRHFTTKKILGWLKPKDVAGGVIIETEGTNQPIPIIYGYQAKSKCIKVLKVTTDKVGGAKNEYLHLVCVFCEGEIEELGTIYFNGISQYQIDTQRYTIERFTGSDTQLASASLTAELSSWASTATLSGLAYAYIRLTMNKKGDWWQGEPTISADIKGLKVLDLRDSVVKYTDNLPLCLYDYATNVRYGKGLLADKIDSQSFIDEADFTETERTYTQTIYRRFYDRESGIWRTLPVGTENMTVVENLMSCNVRLGTSKKVKENFEDLLAGMRAILPETDGKYRLAIEKEGNPVYAFTKENLAGGIQSSGGNQNNRYNRVIIKFRNKLTGENDEATYPEDDADYQTWLTEDNDKPLVGEFTFDTINNKAEALQMGNIIASRSRQQMGATFVGLPETIEVEVGDIVTVDSVIFGWVAKPMRIEYMEVDEDSGECQFQSIEHQNNIYPWNVSDVVEEFVDTSFSLPNEIDAPTGLAFIELTNDDVVQGTVSWDDPNDALIRSHRLEIYSGVTLVDSRETVGYSIDIFTLPVGNYDLNVFAINSLFESPATILTITITVAPAVARHLWLAYADDNLGGGISIDPTGKDWLGSSTGHAVEAADISDPNIFTWQLVKGLNGNDGEVGSSALNSGRRSNDLSLWYGDQGHTVNLSAPFITKTVVDGPIWGDALSLTDNNDNSHTVTSEGISITPGQKYRVSAQVRQPIGDRTNYLIVIFYDSSNVLISNTSTPASDSSGWSGGQGTYNYYLSNSVFPATWTKYSIEFGGDATATIPSNAATMAIGGLFVRAGAVGTETTVDIQDLHIVEVANNGVDGNHAVRIWQRSNTLPATPSGSNPAGWYASPFTANSSSTGTRMYMCTGIKDGSDGLVGAWDVPEWASGFIWGDLDGRPSDVFDLGYIGDNNATRNTGILADRDDVDWLNHLLNRPTELTDGRIQLGLNNFGDVTRDVPNLRITSSSVIQHQGAIDGHFVTNGTAVDIGGHSSPLFIKYPGGGNFNINASAQTGAIKIALPVLWTNTMLKFKISVFDYVANKTFSLEVAGYNYATNSNWQRTSAVIRGNSNTDHSIRFGHDGVSACVWIGETTTIWQYPQVQVSDFQGGYQGATLDNWADGWVVSLVTAFDTVLVTKTDASIGSWNNGVNRPTELTDGRILGTIDSAGNLVTGVGVDQGNGVYRSATRGLSTGNARDGDVINFGTAWDQIPAIKFSAGGLAQSGSLTGDQFQDVKATNISTSGFTVSAKLKEIAGSTVLRTDTGATAGTQDFEIHKSQSAEAFDDTYTFQYDVTIANNFESELGQWLGGTVEVGIYTNDGSGWVKRATVSLNAGFGGLASTTTLSNQIKSVVVTGLTNHGGTEFGISIESDSNGGSTINFDNVTYTTSSAAGETSATPTGTPNLEYFILGGE